MGSRFGGLKQTEKVGPAGETIIEYSIYDAIRSGFGKVVFVIRPELEDLFNEMIVDKLDGKIPTYYAYQEVTLPGYDKAQYPNRVKPWGTGHAILAARDLINEPFAAINADDFYGADSFAKLGKFLSEDSVSRENYCLVAYRLAETISDFGSVSRGVCKINEAGNLCELNERKRIERYDSNLVYYDANDNQISLNGDEQVSMNMWGFHPSLFEKLDEDFSLFLSQNIGSEKAEFLIPEVVMDQVQNGMVTVKALATDEKWLGITYQEDAPFVKQMISRLVEKGIYPPSLWA